MNRYKRQGRKALLVILAAWMWIYSVPASVVQAAPEGMETGNPVPPTNHAEAASLIDVTSGRILYSKKGDERMRIASLTKIMTAIVAIERGNLKDQVKVGKNAYAKEGSSLFLKLGEEMSLENMLYGLMLRSGNDAAAAIAEHVGGSEEGFVMMMNEKAEELGLTGSHFMNPHGLDHDEHYSTANDLAKLTSYALKNPTFQEIVKTQTKTAPNPNEKWDYKWGNKNKMLKMYEGADGVKTGYTKKAFRCLVSSATRNGQQLAVVTLNDGNDWNDHARMLDYGFEHYPLQEITQKGQKIKEHTLVAGLSFQYPLTADEQGRLVKKLILEKQAHPDLSFGLRGFIELSLNGALIGRVPVFEQGSLLPENTLLEKSEASSAPEYRAMTLWERAGQVLKHMFERG